MPKSSNIDKAIAALVAQREPLQQQVQQQVDAINLAIAALRDQQAKKPTPKPRKARVHFANDRTGFHTKAEGQKE